MAARNFLPRCTAFFNRIPIQSLRIRNSNAMHLGKKFFAAIFSVIVYSCCFWRVCLFGDRDPWWWALLGCRFLWIGAFFRRGPRGKFGRVGSEFGGANFSGIRLMVACAALCVWGGGMLSPVGSFVCVTSRSRLVGCRAGVGVRFGFVERLFALVLRASFHSAETPRGGVHLFYAGSFRNGQNRLRFVYTHFGSCDESLDKTSFDFSEVFRTMQSCAMNAKSRIILKLPKGMVT